MDAKIKARSFAKHFHSGEVVRVTGWQDVPKWKEVDGKWREVGAERWCRIRYEGDKRSTMLAHPNTLIPVGC